MFYKMTIQDGRTVYFNPELVSTVINDEKGSAIFVVGDDKPIKVKEDCATAIGILLGALPECLRPK
jgi:hypothetical protein